MFVIVHKASKSIGIGADNRPTKIGSTCADPDPKSALHTRTTLGVPAGNVYLGREHIINGRSPLERENPSKELRADQLALEVIVCPRHRKASQLDQQSPTDRINLSA
jgi:hypothetical protein